MYLCVVKKIILLILTDIKLSRGKYFLAKEQWMRGLQYKQHDQPSNCREQYDKGPCKLKQWKWAYVSESNKCAQVPYSGCGGSGNIFDDRTKCESDCVVTITAESCRAPMDYGTCTKKTKQFFFHENQCLEFQYSGCGGNSNRFKNKAECEKSCNQWIRPADFDTQSSSSEGECLDWYDFGSCKESKWKWGYISGSNVCGKFPYSGCGGSENIFSDEKKCNEKCLITVAPEICRQPMEYGNCDKKVTQFFYTEHTDQCTSFKYSGCGGNSNRFRNKKECEEACRAWVRPSDLGGFSGHRKPINSVKDIVFHKSVGSGVMWSLGVVPYYVDKNYYDNAAIDRLRSAMDFLESVSCIKFKNLPEKPKSNTLFWLLFDNPSMTKSCDHQPVIDGSAVKVVLGYDCLQRHELLHTILHGLGLKDEVTHPQRDNYVRIMWDNIHPEYRYLFHLNSGNETVVEYDPLSVMHFHERAFSKNGRPSITPLLPGLQIKPSKKLSQLDQMKLNLIFGHECKKRDVGDLLKTCKRAFHSLQSNTNEKQDDNYEETNMNLSDDKKDGTSKEAESKVDNLSVQNNVNEISGHKESEYEENDKSLNDFNDKTDEIVEPLKLQYDKKTCSLQPERGTCQDKIVKWFFDSKQNDCVTFSYGGCGGNSNKVCSKTNEESHTSCSNFCYELYL